MGQASIFGPRIYNLFPLLAGAIERWPEHLPRITRMGFDWIYVNPFQEPGASGSLYAIKDPGRLHPVVQGDSRHEPESLIRAFTNACREAGIRVMVDLVINHTATDALLVDAHPDWFQRDEDGTLRSPRAVDPLDPRKVTVWGDLAEIDYGNPAVREAQVAHWQAEIERWLDLGAEGFRCDAAYQVPAEVWSTLTAVARRKRKDAVFAAETLGCTSDQVLALAPCGFDLFFNSVKWWDFSDDWVLEQYALYRPIAPTIAFPESHDTERLAAEGAGEAPAVTERRARQRTLLAASFSSGLMIPMGFEYGFMKRLHVVDTRPGDWAWEAEHPRYDLTGFLAAVNGMKAAHPVLGVEGEQQRLTAPGAPVTILLRSDGGSIRTAGAVSVAMFNADTQHPHTIDPGRVLAATGGRFETFRDVTPDAEPLDLSAGKPLVLEPETARVFVCESPRVAGAGKLPSRTQSERQIAALAANRVAIEAVSPQLDGGRFPVKRVVGDVVDISADIFCDGHDRIDACIRYRMAGERSWREAPMVHIDNDRWVGRLPLNRIGRWEYEVTAWRDLFGSWRSEVSKKIEAGLDVSLEIQEGREQVHAALDHAGRDDAAILRNAHEASDTAPQGQSAAVLLGAAVADAMARSAPRNGLTGDGLGLAITVDRPAARFAAWYEMFPRSQGPDARSHGTFADVIGQLPRVRDMGFDVLYFPPIHPIGKTNRKGRNNSLTPGPDDPGSPYAIGSAEGGHDAIHPELGTLDDFRRLVAAAEDHGLEIAIDFAIQCSPDHPWLKEHPEWFDWRPDGTIKYAENPPKKYEDIVNVHFYREALPSIWFALRDVVLFWAKEGVRTFRVDNPHTKPYPFWEWLIAEVKAVYPDALFLAEAFTRPKVMNRLAKLGFSQSYTYFTWRDHKQELTDYVTELTRGPAREFFRPNFFANTPDINPPVLQGSEPAAHKMRLVLAGTLAGLYGIYNGFEISEGTPIPGREEYLDSEKYEIRHWDWNRPGNLVDYIATVNRIRRANPALHDHLTVEFLNAWNDNILAYRKMTPERDNLLVVAVNLDPKSAHEADFEVPLWEFGLPDHGTVAVEDLFTGRRFQWTGKVQHLRLDPADNPCAIWRISPVGG